MQGVNKVILIGVLGKDPEVRYAASGNVITSFSVATGESWVDKNTGEKKEKTEWHDIVLFNRLAEVARDYLSKGQKVYIEGKIRTEKWQDKEGNNRYTTRIYGDSMQMLSPKKEAKEKKEPNTDERKEKKPAKAFPSDLSSSVEDEEDIPF